MFPAAIVILCTVIGNCVYIDSSGYAQLGATSTANPATMFRVEQVYQLSSNIMLEVLDASGSSYSPRQWFVFASDTSGMMSSSTTCSLDVRSLCRFNVVMGTDFNVALLHVGNGYVNTYATFGSNGVRWLKMINTATNGNLMYEIHAVARVLWNAAATGTPGANGLTLVGNFVLSLPWESATVDISTFLGQLRLVHKKDTYATGPAPWAVYIDSDFQLYFKDLASGSWAFVRSDRHLAPTSSSSTVGSGFRVVLVGRDDVLSFLGPEGRAVSAEGSGVPTATVYPAAQNEEFRLEPVTWVCNLAAILARRAAETSGRQFVAEAAVASPVESSPVLLFGLPQTVVPEGKVTISGMTIEKVYQHVSKLVPASEYFELVPCNDAGVPTARALLWDTPLPAQGHPDAVGTKITTHLTIVYGRAASAIASRR